MATTRPNAGSAALESAQRTIEELRAQLDDLEVRFQRIQCEFYVALIKLGGQMEMLNNEPYPSGIIHLTVLPDRCVFRVEIGADAPELRVTIGAN
jgi:hypothetical protein